jgi:osmotically-inducible protein OsmY
MARRKKTDEELRTDVLCELECDSRIRASEIGVQVDRGVVTLTGNIDSWGKKLAAEEDAHRVAGVLDVANDIQIRVPGSAPNDTDIAKAVRNALEWDVFVPNDQIKSTVSQGTVTLTGKVDSLRASLDAESAVRNLNGVRRVHNEIEVAKGFDAAQVREAVQQALERVAAAEARQISVEVGDGTVRLSGTVHSWADRDAAIRAASAAPGVRKVEPDLMVDGYTTT